MRVLLDTNVLLDALLAREPFVREAAELFALAERRRYAGVVAATSVPTVHYLVEKEEDGDVALRGVGRLLRLFDVAAVGRPELSLERTSGSGGTAHGPFDDYEDGVVHAAAVSAGCDGIVTRNGEDFAASTVPVYTPGELLAALATEGRE